MYVLNIYLLHVSLFLPVIYRSDYYLELTARNKQGSKPKGNQYFDRL